MQNMSHPVWVRGLKHMDSKSKFTKGLSHPVWVRGLKQPLTINMHRRFRVAPRVGAWIETLNNFLIHIVLCFVAPRVGAWIETEL